MMDGREHLREQTYLAAEREITMREELAAVREEELNGVLPDGRPMWTSDDDLYLQTAEEIQWFTEWQGEALAEIGSDYFMDTRNAADAMLVAQQYVNERVANRFGGVPVSKIEEKYVRLYARPAKNVESYRLKSDRKRVA
jgi:hypothetical protein